MTAKGEAEAVFKPINYANEVQRLILNNPLVHMAHQSYRTGQRDYTGFLEVAVYLLAEQNATLMEKVRQQSIKLLEMEPAGLVYGDNTPPTGAP